MNPLRLARSAAVALLAITVAGCATTRVYSFLERGTDFARYRTYDWATDAPRTTGDPRLDSNPFFEERVQHAVDEQLARRGFEKTTSGTSELRLHYHASISQELDLAGADLRYGVNASSPYVYDAGTLVIDLVDNRTDKLIWRGWSEGGLDNAIDNQDFMEARIDETVRRIMDRLPRRF
jgi:uncharacterized protein DUF4136